jgi:hypothetical protein
MFPAQIDVISVVVTSAKITTGTVELARARLRLRKASPKACPMLEIQRQSVPLIFKKPRHGGLRIPYVPARVSGMFQRNQRVPATVWLC